MDYDQRVKTDSQRPFFTTGAGTNQDSVDNFEAENNLDIDNEQMDWDATDDRYARNMGSIAINSPELPKSLSDRAMPNGEELPKMGEIVETGLLPDEFANKNTADTSAKDGEKSDSSEDLGNILPFDRKKIKTGEMLGEEGVREMQTVISKLDQDGNVADFYDVSRDMMEANLTNSYGDNAAWKGGKAA